MKVFNSKLAAIGLAAFVFASCSDSSSDPATPITPGTVPSEITKIGLTQTDAAQLAASVTNYKRSSSNKARTRAIDETLFKGLTQMPDVPSNEDAVQLNAAKDLSNEKYKTRNGKTYDFSNNTLQNATLFVVGNSTVKYNDLGTGNTIIVQKGGKLEYTGNGTAIPQNNTIIVLESGSYSIANNENIIIDGALYSSRALGKIEGQTTGDKKSEGTPTQNITINGSVFLSGYKHEVTDPKSDNYGQVLTEYASLRAKTLTINAGAKVNTLNRVTFTNDVVIAGALHVGQTAIVKNMTIKNGGKFYSDYSAKIKNKLTMEAGSYMNLAYLNVTDNKYDKNGTEEKPTKTLGDAVADLQGNCQIVIGNHGVMSFNTLKTDNTTGQIVMGNDANNVAVIKADKFIYAGNDENVNFTITPNTNNQTILAQFKECYKNGSESEGNKVEFEYLNWNSDVQSYDYITGGGALIAGPNFSYKLKDEYKVADQKKLMLLSTIANYDRDTQSATAIVPTDDNKVYVSYHTNGTDFGGSIDVAEMNGEQLTLKQRVQQAEAGATYDFNHLNVIDSKLYLAGSAKGKDGKQYGGATISYAAIESDGKLNVTEGLSTLPLDNAVKGDANCVVPFGNKIVVANTKGYDVVEKDLSDNKNTKAPGKAKFAAVSGSSLVGLNYTSEITAGDAEVQGEVQVFDNSMKQTSSFNVGSIAPNNGKNMIAIDSNGRIYVCKSAKGLMCYESNGNQAWASEWTTPTSNSDKNVSVDKRKGYINGVAVDDNYVYVAAGAYGLVVLNKNGEEVTHKRIGTAGNSANYVAVKNGLIYVAYGKGRIQVFKLTSGAAQ